MKWAKGSGLSAADFTLTAYSRKLESVEELTQYIKYDVESRGESDELFLQFFKRAIEMYLSVPGHPPGMEGFVSQEDIDKAKDDPLCRAHLFLAALTQFGVKPVQDGWRIYVRKSSTIPSDPSSHSSSQIELETAAMYEPLPSSPTYDDLPPPFKIAVCLRTATFRYTPHLHEVVKKRLSTPGDPPGVHQFDRWLHSQLLVTDYNKR